MASKRKRAGESVWTPTDKSSSTISVTSTSQPPTKRARAKVSNQSGPSTTVRGSTESAAISSASSSRVGNQKSEPSYSKNASKSRKKSDSDAPQPEKRGAIFKKACPKNILERVDRVMSQRFYMIDRQRTPDELEEVFSVLGSTGNVYTVKINHKPSCNCPDAEKGNHCKHILFIFLKVLQVNQASSSWYQKALLTSELEAIFAEAPLAPNSVAHPRICEAYAGAIGKSVDTAQPSLKKRIPGPGDDCPICYEGMHGTNEKSLVFCEDCGNALHKECFQQWQASSRRDGKETTCVWCRARWTVPGTTNAGSVRTSEGYLNLGDVSGTSPIRDTSTYYHGPRRGQRYYRYRDYD